MSKRISLSSIGVGALWLAWAGSLVAAGPTPDRLAILPDLTHYDICSSPRLATTVLPFLNGESDAKSWAEQVSASKK